MFDYPEFVLAKEGETRLQVENVYTNARGALHLGTDYEARVLYELAGGLHDDLDDGYIVEFGSFMGITAAALAHGAEYYNKQLPVIAVDNYIWNPTALPVAQYMFSCIGQANNICQIVFDDLRAFKLLCNFPVRLLFIDADHGYKHVMETLETCVPKIEPGGWVALHDYAPQSPNTAINEVVQATQDFLKTAHDEFESTFLTHSLLCLKKR